jgi:hypothetical protein
MTSERRDTLNVRKLLVAALMAGGFSVSGGFLAAAHANSTCDNAGGLPTVGASKSQVCITQGPVQGTLTASGDPAAQKGYVVADGSPSNPGALGGYVGVDSDNGGQVTACSGQAASGGNYSGEYQPGAGTPAGGAGNNTVVSGNGAVNLPAPLGPGGPCDAHQ